MGKTRGIGGYFLSGLARVSGGQVVVRSLELLDPSIDPWKTLIDIRETITVSDRSTDAHDPCQRYLNGGYVVPCRFGISGNTARVILYARDVMRTRISSTGRHVCVKFRISCATG